MILARRPRAHEPRSRRRPGAGDLARLALILGFVAAPVAGDIGGCGQEVEDLDGAKFFLYKDYIDCQRCTECGLLSEACARACERASELEPETTEFPPGCYPLAHDGEVCLHALNAASCGDYEQYTADEAPTTPTECNFCPPDQRPPSAAPATSTTPGELAP